MYSTRPRWVNINSTVKYILQGPIDFEIISKKFGCHLKAVLISKRSLIKFCLVIQTDFLNVQLLQHRRANNVHSLTNFTKRLFNAHEQHAMAIITTRRVACVSVCTWRTWSRKQLTINAYDKPYASSSSLDTRVHSVLIKFTMTHFNFLVAFVYFVYQRCPS